MTNAFEQILASANALLEPRLDTILEGKGGLNEAMRYAVLGGGKRFRPFLVLESAKLFEVSQESALSVALAVELAHCYSLVHDDLPSMDNDDMRRGKPSVHAKFGEAIAILAGDALQSLAFELMSEESAELTRELAKSIGRTGMAGGQELDLENSGDIERVAAMKTGALIRFAVLSGAMLSNALNDDKEALDLYANRLGLAFQLSDDILDAAKDEVKHKRTFISELGVAETKKRLAGAANDAIATLERFGEKAAGLREAARYLSARAA